MFPFADDNPRNVTPYVTVALIGLCGLVFLWQMTLDPESAQIR